MNRFTFALKINNDPVRYFKSFKKAMKKVNVKLELAEPETLLRIPGADSLWINENVNDLYSGQVITITKYKVY